VHHIFGCYDDFVGQKEVLWSASKVLALATLFLRHDVAETEWKEFTSSKGNFKSGFPELPNNKRSLSRNLHRSVLLSTTSLTD